MTDAEFTDEDLVYVDPEKRTIVAKVEWSKNGAPKKLEMASEVEEDEEDNDKGKGKRGRHRKKRKRYYPWGTFRSMKKLYRVRGKEKEIESYRPIEEAISLALNEPYWD